jgi:protein gp37
MRLNRTGIEWTDYTVNPFYGCLGASDEQGNQKPCPFCYARKLARRFGQCELCKQFIPHFHPERLEGKMPRKAGKVFVGSMSDVCGQGIEPEWVRATLEVCAEYPDWTFQFLTKSPQGLSNYDWPPNCWVGVTINWQKDAWRLDYLRACNARTRFVSLEPMYEAFALPGWVDWLIIGPQTNPSRRPLIEQVISTIGQARAHGIPVFVKPALGMFTDLQQFPDSHSDIS